MVPLDKAYEEHLEAIKEHLQQSELLAQYLETEEEEDYLALKELYEPHIAQLYEQVATENPLQLIDLERKLMDPGLEGLFLQRILGFAVLRGVVDEQTMKYIFPQEHFKEVLTAICHSSNFEILKKRIGQTIQMGFALSSDIWVTNLINSFEVRRIRNYLNAQRLERYRTPEARRAALARYRKQFENQNFYTTKFPDTLNELSVWAESIKQFLIYRITHDLPNDSIRPSLHRFVMNEAFFGSRDHLYIAMLYAMYFDRSEEENEALKQLFTRMRKELEYFEEWFFDILLELHNRPDIAVDAAADLRMSKVIDRKVKDEVAAYYDLMETLHGKGFQHEEALQAVKAFYDAHPGLSTINECVRRTLFRYFSHILRNLDESEYPEMFQLFGHMRAYMDVFLNEKFKSDLRHELLAYIRRLQKTYTDKRGKDYQDIKKFVAGNFPEAGLLTDKQVVELFKTRRKKKAGA